MKICRIFPFFLGCSLFLFACTHVDPDHPNIHNIPPDEQSSCRDGQVWGLIDPCGEAPCEDGGCPQVCVPIFGCIDVIDVGEECSPGSGQCGTDAKCKIALDSCLPTVCPPNQSCNNPCIPSYTCQANPTGDNCDTVECGLDEKCEVVEVYPDCGPECHTSVPIEKAQCLAIDRVECQRNGDECSEGEACSEDYRRPTCQSCDDMSSGRCLCAYPEYPYTCQPLSMMD